MVYGVLGVFSYQKLGKWHDQRSQTSIDRNCLGQFRDIPWNKTTYVHRGSTLMTPVIT